MLGINFIKQRINPNSEGIFRCPKCDDEMWQETEDAYQVFDDLYTDMNDIDITYLYCDWCIEGFVFIDDVPECVKTNLSLRGGKKSPTDRAE